MQNDETARNVHRTATNLVEREIYCCVSNLVHRLAQLEDETAVELSLPVLDFDDAAIEGGWKLSEQGWLHSEYTEEVFETSVEACERSNLDPHEREVFEHWAISQWLASRLDELGEKVSFDFYGLAVWARTTTGQAISIDCCIERIARKLTQGL